MVRSPRTRCRSRALGVVLARAFDRLVWAVSDPLDADTMGVCSQRTEIIRV